MDKPTLIPLSNIDAEALPRDRARLDPQALDTLLRAILSEGLRQPIEIYPVDPQYEGAPEWALISGLRRLTCYRTLHENYPGNWAEIPCFIRQPADISTALAAMVSENENRAQISPWEKARLVIETTDHEIFATHDAALKALFPLISRTMQQRIRHFVDVVEAFDGLLAGPENLSQRQMERLSMILREGLLDLAEVVLRETDGQSLASQWAALEPVLMEAASTREAQGRRKPKEPGRPIRHLRLRQGLVIRREMTKEGWALKFSGPEARPGALLDDVFIIIERWFRMRD